MDCTRECNNLNYMNEKLLTENNGENEEEILRKVLLANKGTTICENLSSQIWQNML